MGHILMDEMPICWLDGRTDVLRRLFHKFFRTFPHTSVLWWGIGRAFGFGKIYGGEINLSFHNF